MKATLFTDGGSRGNPGAAAIGYVLTPETGKAMRHGETIGVATNNQAEYQALLAGMRHARKLKISHLSCFLDSELVVKQLTGIYRIKDADLRVHATAIAALVKEFQQVKYTHVRREKNKEADSLVNEALDNA